MNVFELFAKISLDTKDYESGLTEAKGKAQKFASGVATGAKVGAAAVAAIGTAVMGAGAAFVDQTGKVAEYGDHIDKMSQKIGISAKAYQEWDAIMQHSGASIDSLRPAMKTLATQAQQGNEAFQKLGISEEKVASLSSEDLFAEVIKGLQGMEEGTERTYLASQLLGRGATELGALLNTSAEETENMRQKVHELGGVMSDEAVKAAAKYQDTLQDLQTGIQSLKRNLVSEFLPSVTTVMEGLTEIFTGSSDKGLEIISEGINNLITKLTEELPKFLEVVSGIAQAILEGIVENLPKIVEAGTDIVLKLFDGIIQNLPKIIEAGIKAIVALINGIAKALPKLVPAIVNGVLLVVKTLIENLPLLLNAVLTIMKELAKGIVKAIPVIIEALPEIIKAIVEFFMDAIPQIIEAGIELLTSLIAALPDIILAIVKALPELIAGIIEGILSHIGEFVAAGVELLVALITDIPTIILEIVKRIPEIVEGIIDGFADAFANGDFGRAIKALADGLMKGILKSDFLSTLLKFFGVPVDMFKKAYKIQSPSKVTTYLGEMLGKGYTNGIVKSGREVIKAAQSMSDNLDDVLSQDHEIAMSYQMDEIAMNRNAFMSAEDGYLGGSDAYEEEIIIPRSEANTERNLTVILELDRVQLGRAVYTLNNEETQRVGVHLAGVKA